MVSPKNLATLSSLYTSTSSPRIQRRRDNSRRQVLSDGLSFRNISNASRRREPSAFSPIDLDYFIDKLAEFGDDLLYVVSVTSSVKQAWAGSDEALIFRRLLYNFGIVRALSHFLDSSIADFTSLSR